jgi:hypothetical protein
VAELYAGGVGLRLEQLRSLGYRVRFAATTATVVLAGLFSLALVQPASAAPLTANGVNVTPDAYTASPGTQIATGAGSDNIVVSGVTVGSYTEFVYKAAVAAASTGAGECINCLNYLITVHTDPGAEISKISLSNFSAGNPLDAGYLIDPANDFGSGQTGKPQDVSESSDGTTVTFTYSPALNVQGTTDFLEVETSSTAVIKTGSTCVNTSPNFCGPSYEPSPAPPIGYGLPVLLAVGAMLFGAKLLQRGRKRRSPGTAISQAAA